MGLVEGLTASVEGLDKLMSEASLLLPALLRLLGADRDTSRAALTSLINLCQACCFLLIFPGSGQSCWSSMLSTQLAECL